MHALAEAVVEQIEATATILSVSETGMTVGSNPIVDIRLSVAQPGEPAYEAEARELVFREILPALKKGREIPVTVDPYDPSRVRLDDETRCWGSPSRPPIRWRR